MKIKGITIWEQYLEFFVLAIAAGVFVVFTAMQFIGNPNTVKQGPDEYSPGNVDQELVAAAEAVSGRLAADAPPPIDFASHDPVLPEFDMALTSSVSPTNRLAQMWKSFPVDEVGSVVAGGKPFIEPEIAAPYNVVAKQSFDALLPEVVAHYDELQERFPEEPYDIAWVTVAAKFNVKNVLDQFKTAGPNGELPFQERWYGGRVDIMDVKLERQEYVDGVWTNETLMEPIPGQVSFREDLQEEDIRAQDRDFMLEDLADEEIQEAVIRPDFLATLGDWLPPNPDEEQIDQGPGVELTPEELAIQRAQRNLRRLEARLENVMQRLEEAGGPLEPDDDRGSGRDGGGRSGGGGGPPGGGEGPSPGGGGSGAGTRGGGDNAAGEAQRLLRIRLTRTMHRLERQIEEIRRTLEELGAMVVEVEEVEESPDEVVVWAHDMSVEQGKTYRYRLRVDVYNPVFAKKLHLPEEQHQRADEITIASANSDWTNPVKAEEWLKVFVTQAQGPEERGDMPGNLGLGSARVDVFRFQNGRWWRETFSVEPGDRIGEVRQVRSGGREGEPVLVDFSTSWYLLDVIEDIEADDEDRRRGYGAQALLQGLTEADRLAMRDPPLEFRDRVRQRLLEEVELAEIATQVEGTTSN